MQCPASRLPPEMACTLCHLKSIVSIVIIGIANDEVRMNIRDLEYVVAVAEESHFGRAAERCHVSQPALSGQIKKLEDRLGVSFFERTNRRVSVTPVGAEIVVLAKRLLLIADEIENTAASHADPMAGRVRLGTIPTIAPYLLPSVLRPLKDSLPAVRFMLTEDITENLERRVSDGDLDAAVTATRPVVPGLAQIDLYQEPFLIALPQDHPLRDRKEVDVRALDLSELLLLRDGHCLSNQVASLCGLSRRKTDAELDTQASSLSTIVGLVAAEAGITFLPATAASAETATRRNVVTVAAKNKAASRRVRLIFRETYPKRALMEAIADGMIRHLPAGAVAC